MLVGASPRRVAIVGGVRIPFARGNGAYAQVGNQEMLTAALRGVVERFGLRGQRVDDVAAGAVIKHSSQWDLTRESVLGCGLAAETPGLDLQRACGTSLEAAILLGNKIALGQIDCAIAGGVDTVSDPPVVYPRSFQQLLLRSYRGKTAIARVKPWFGLRPKNFRPVLPGVTEPRTGLSMGESTELMVKTWGITRAEQDQLALESHQKAAAAYAQGFYKDLVIEYLGLTQDNNIRADSSLEKLAKLQPAFDFSGAGTLTAGNSTPMTDGACRRVVGLRGVGPRAQSSGAGVFGLRQGRGRRLHRKEGGLAHGSRLCGSSNAERCEVKASGLRLLRNTRSVCRTGIMHVEGLDRPGVLPRQTSVAGPLGAIDRSKLNVKGGSLAIGHPFAATGARIVATLAKILDETKGKRGLISVCTAGGMGVTAILER